MYPITLLILHRTRCIHTYRSSLVTLLLPIPRIVSASLHVHVMFPYIPLDLTIYRYHDHELAIHHARVPAAQRHIILKSRSDVLMPRQRTMLPLDLHSKKPEANGVTLNKTFQSSVRRHATPPPHLPRFHPPARPPTPRTCSVALREPRAYVIAPRGSANPFPASRAGPDSPEPSHLLRPRRPSLQPPRFHHHVRGENRTPIYRRGSAPLCPPA